MICPVCGAVNEESSVFCFNCGNNLSAALSNGMQAANETNNYQAEAPVYTDIGYAPVITGDTDTTSDGFEPVGSFTQQPSVENIQKKAKPSKEKKKSRLPLIITLSVIGVVVAAAVAFILILLNKPMMKLGTAVQKMLTSGDTYSVSVTVDGEKQGDGTFFVDPGKKSAGFRLESSDSQRYFYVNLDEDVFMKKDNRSVTVNKLYAELDTNGEITYAVAMSDEVYEQNKKSAEFVFKALGFLDKPTTFKETSLNELIEEYAELSDGDADELYAKLEELTGLSKDEIKTVFDVLSKKLIKAFNDKKWLEENMGLEISNAKGGKTFSYEFSLYDLAKALNVLLQDCEKDLEDIDGIEEILEIADEGVDWLEGFFGDSGNVQFSYTIKSGIIKNISFELDDFASAELDFEKDKAGFQRESADEYISKIEGKVGTTAKATNCIICSKDCSGDSLSREVEYNGTKGKVCGSCYTAEQWSCDGCKKSLTRFDKKNSVKEGTASLNYCDSCYGAKYTDQWQCGQCKAFKSTQDKKYSLATNGTTYTLCQACYDSSWYCGGCNKTFLGIAHQNSYNGNIYCDICHKNITRPSSNPSSGSSGNESSSTWTCDNCYSTFSYDESRYYHPYDDYDDGDYCYDCCEEMYDEYTSWYCDGCGNCYDRYEYCYEHPEYGTGQYCYDCYETLYEESTSWVCDECYETFSDYDSQYSHPEYGDGSYCYSCYYDLLDEFSSWTCDECYFDFSSYDVAYTHPYYNDGQYCADCWDYLYSEYCE